MDDKLRTYLLDFKAKSGRLVQRIKPLTTNLFEKTKTLIFDLPRSYHRVVYYIKIWLTMSKNSFMVYMIQKKLLIIFLAGKLLRFGLFIGFLYFLVVGTNTLAGYSVNQTIFFFLTFNAVDVVTQFLFREVYRFRPLVVSGDLDLVLAKPMSALFRVLMGGADVIDLVTIPPLLVAVWYVGSLLNPTFTQTSLYILLLVSAFFIATAFHIIILAFGILTLAVDHTIMIYRDLTNLGKLPVDIYKQPLQGVLTYLIPVGIMITLPAKALMGLVSLWGVILSLLLAILLMFVSLKYWNYALTKYTSASS